MAKPWVEGGYYEECSRKWGWKNKEGKNKSKVTQELVERKVKRKNIQEIQERKEESHLHKWRKKGKEQGERIWETAQNKMIENGMFRWYVKEGKKSLKYT